jgi:hypothetical protein
MPRFAEWRALAAKIDAREREVALKVDDPPLL